MDLSVENFIDELERCEYSLLGHSGSDKLKPVFEELLRNIGDDERFDVYGNGKLISDFENCIAELWNLTMHCWNK